MALRLLAAGIAYLVCFVVAYGLVVRGTPPSPGVEPISPALAILLVSGLNTAVMSWLILRSRLLAWSLAAAMVLLFFGVQTFMPQVESLIFQANPGYASAPTRYHPHSPMKAALLTSADGCERVPADG
jgi:hypothetical protein